MYTMQFIIINKANEHLKSHGRFRRRPRSVSDFKLHIFIFYFVLMNFLTGQRSAEKS